MVQKPNSEINSENIATNSGAKKWMYIIIGVILLLLDSGIAFVGFLAVALSADGGMSAFIKSLITVLIITLLLGGLGVWLILKGLNIKFNAKRRDDEDRKGHFNRMAGYFIFAFVLSIISDYTAGWLITKYIYHGEGRITPFSVVSFLLGIILYYTFINKPWPKVKKAIWCIVTFIVLYLILPTIPVIGFEYLRTGKLPTPSQYKQVEAEKDYIKNLFIEETEHFIVTNTQVLGISDPNEIYKKYQAQVFTKNGNGGIYMNIFITITSQGKYSKEEQAELMRPLGSQYDIEVDGQKVRVDDYKPVDFVSHKWVSGNVFIEISEAGKYPNTDEIVRAMLKKYPSTLE